ncbi:hypothetical protein BASA82_001200 [Batrachochytrium salamandrivorans]|nr:hypothetical protein BASA82_001200 [Batrachochytrium salamandrivorans]
MQFLCMFSFVVVASYAAALPQPAELSKRYSNNIDVDLASGLEARLYQPGLNSQGDSANLVLLKRRDNSGGPSGGNGRSGTPPSPDPESIQKILDDAFKRGYFSSANISSTIDKVRDGMVHLYGDGPKAGVTVGGPAGEMLTSWLWAKLNSPRSLKIFFITLDALKAEATENENKAAISISNIVNHINTTIQNVER